MSPEPPGRPRAPGLPIRRWVAGQGWSSEQDHLGAEEPLQLSIGGVPLSVVMRTPGNDLELALGLLWAERVITSRLQILSARISAESAEAESQLGLRSDLLESNQIDVELTAGAALPERSFLQSSACGVCGATTIESLALDFPRLSPGPSISAGLLPELARRLRSGQDLFEKTGALHAAGLFQSDGELLILREDIGRHNAVDKVVGRALLDGRLPASDSVLVVSGRGGYELAQKAVAAGIPILAAVGAPSSLAVATALRFGLTLVGFLREGRFNVYSGPERIS